MAEPECLGRREMIEKLMNSISDRARMDMMREDTETLEKKICLKVIVPNLSKTFSTSAGNSSSITAVYLIATLGESE